MRLKVADARSAAAKTIKRQDKTNTEKAKQKESVKSKQ